MINIWESQYLWLIRSILEKGTDCPDRTGIGCRKLLNRIIEIDLSTGHFPGSTIRLVGPRIGFEEFWAFLNGVVMIDQHLRERNVTYTTLDGEVKTIWTGNTSREFLDKRGLHYLPEGHLGKGYGFQFRNWGGDYWVLGWKQAPVEEGMYATDLGPDYTKLDRSGIDQIQNAWNTLKNDPYSRRVVVTLLNPLQEKEMAITPCWHTHKFSVLDGKLHLSVVGRSCDVLFGTPTNIQQYSLYLIAMAKSLGYTPGTLHCLLEDAHIYHNQIQYCEELVTRQIYDSPKVKINKEMSSLDDVLSLRWTDFEFENVQVNKTPFNTPRPDMAV